MGKRGYVIQKLGYEYDDETYSQSEEGGGVPLVVLTNEVEAKKRFLELEIKEWKGKVVGHYGYDLTDVASDYNEFEKALESMGLETEDLWDVKIPENATDDQIKKLIKSSKIRFHEIVTVEIEETLEEEAGPTESILNTQSILTKSKSSIFDSVNQFTNPEIVPTKIPDEVTINDIKAVVKETDDSFLGIKEEMKRLHDEARTKVKSFFLKGMNKIFETHPEVKSVAWHQYTPYFNDGEECTFRAQTDDFYVNGVDNYGDTMYGYEKEDFEGEPILDSDELKYNWVKKEGQSRSVKQYKNPESNSVKIYEAISGFLKQLDDDDYKTMFGDHAVVIVKKNEVTVEEYDHD